MITYKDLIKKLAQAGLVVDDIEDVPRGRATKEAIAHTETIIRLGQRIVKELNWDPKRAMGFAFLWCSHDEEQVYEAKEVCRNIAARANESATNENLMDIFIGMMLHKIPTDKTLRD